MEHKVGDTVNGHTLGADNAWHPVSSEAPTAPQVSGGPVEVKGHTGTVIWDGDFVTIKRTGFLARASVGKGEKRIPIGSITAVQWKPAGAMVNGFIQFTMAGGNEARSKFGSQTTDAAKDENSVVFVKKQMPEFDALRSSIERAMVERSRPAPTTSSAPAAPDYLAQLKQLGELRDAGILSDSEFETKKAEILARL
jgi:hypothetical protein